MRVRSSWTDQQLTDIVGECATITDVLNRLGLIPAGGNYKTVKKALARLGLVLTGPRKKHPSSGLPRVPPIPLEQILVENSGYGTNALRLRLITSGSLENKCTACGVRETWNNKPITLHLDHINGVSTDHRIGNLQLLCPNCHSQTDTYCGRNKAKSKQSKWKIDPKPAKPFRQCSCGRVLKSARATQCRSCSQVSRQAKERSATKIAWPTPEEVLARVNASSYSKVAKELGVSDTSVKQYLLRNQMKRTNWDAIGRNGTSK
jgi:hypothetical protein